MRFSVIVPIYNCEAYLAAALESVLAQTYRDWECICVDDGSTDGSGRIADEYAARDARFRVIHQKNGGVGDARNTALDVANGDWVCFLDADDVFNVGALLEYARMVDEFPTSDLVAVKYLDFCDGASILWPQAGQPTTRVYDIRDSMPVEPYGLQLWCAAYRRAIATSVRFEGLKIGEDRVYVIQILERSCQVVFSDFVGYGYRLRSESAAHSRYTAERFLHNLRHRMVCVDIFRKTRKCYNPAIFSNFAMRHTGYAANLFFGMSRADQNAAAGEWFAGYREAAKFSCWPKMPHLIMRVCGRARSRLVAWLLIFLPYWLKQHGVNRKFVVAKPQPIPRLLFGGRGLNWE